MVLLSKVLIFSKLRSFRDSYHGEGGDFRDDGHVDSMSGRDGGGGRVVMAGIM